MTTADALDRESEEVEPLVDRHNAGFLWGELEPERCDHLLDLGFQRLGVLLAASYADDVESDRGALPIFRVGAFPRPAPRTGRAHY